MRTCHASLLALLAGLAPAQGNPTAVENPSIVDPLAGFLVAPILAAGVSDAGRLHLAPKVGAVSWLASSVRRPTWDLALGEVDCSDGSYAVSTCLGDPMAALNTAAHEWSPTLDPTGLHVVFQRGLAAPVLWCASRLTTASCFGAPAPVNAVLTGPGLLRDPQFGFTSQGLTLFFRRTLGGVDTIEGAPYTIGTCTLGAACTIATAGVGREVYAPMPMNDSGGRTRIMVFNERGAGDTPPHSVRMTSGLEGNTPILTVLTSPPDFAFEYGDANCGTLTLVARYIPLNMTRYIYRVGICALSSLTVPSPGFGELVLFGPERCSGRQFAGVLGFGPMLGTNSCPGSPFVGCLGIAPVAVVAVGMDTCSSGSLFVSLPAGLGGCPLVDLQGLIWDMGSSTGYFSNTAQVCVGTPCF